MIINKKIGLYTLGSTIEVTIGPNSTYDFPVSNEGPSAAFNTELEITIPAGLQLKAGESSVSKGTFDESTKIWSMGVLLTTDTPEASFVFEVTDSCHDNYQIIFTITSDVCDCDISNNRTDVIVEGTSCCDIQTCTPFQLLYSIPSTAFLDTANPTTSEVDAWASTNVQPFNVDGGIIGYREPGTPSSEAFDHLWYYVDGTNTEKLYSRASQTKEMSLIANYNSIDSNVILGDSSYPEAVGNSLDGMVLVNALAIVAEKGITGTTDIMIRRERAGVNVDMLSTPITIGDEFFAEDGVIDLANDDVQKGDLIYVDVDALHSGTPPKGLRVILEFQAP